MCADRFAYSQPAEPLEYAEIHYRADRYKFFRKLVDSSPRREYLSDYHQESMLRSLDSAHRLLSSKERAAFDVSAPTIKLVAGGARCTARQATSRCPPAVLV